ncbi:hypothetical protein KKC94_02035 [Patescibacteria group bacterium]|nr:hypothetical protein [Patescibacteria group bacterium]
MENFPTPRHAPALDADQSSRWSLLTKAAKYAQLISLITGLTACDSEKLEDQAAQPNPTHQRALPPEVEQEKLYQEFELAEHDVISAEKISQRYVSQITGSVDVNPYTKEPKSPDFYRTEVIEPCTLLLAIYNNNPDVLTNEAINFIQKNIGTLKKLDAQKPATDQEFRQATANIPNDEIYGPEGVLNLLLAFNRVNSKLEGNLVRNLTNPETELTLKIDLKNRDRRYVEVGLYTPEISEPNVGAVKLDYPNLQTSKRQRQDGKYEVHYFTKLGEPLIILTIDPKNRNVKVSSYLNPNGVKTVTLTFDKFDQKLQQNPYFLHGV